MHPLLPTLTQNLRDTVFGAIGHAPPRRALVVFDLQSELSSLLAEGYRAALPDAQFVDFDETTPEQVRASMNVMSPGDLVVLVQSGSFRLDNFRFRLELFKRDLRVIEHPHLRRMAGEELATYVDAIAYDAGYYRTVGPKIKAAVDGAARIVVSCAGTELVYDGPFETAKLNTGDYAGMKNVGGQFPIGEVFTEPTSLENVNGTVDLYAFADTNFELVVPPVPIRATVERGILTDVAHAPPEFVAMMEHIRADEALTVRELGFGMNRALTRHRFLKDVGSYERMCGVHVSLGGKHTIYAKPGFPKRTSLYHVDVFVDVTTVTVDGTVIFRDGAYVV